MGIYIEQYYKAGYYDNEKLKVFVSTAYITADKYKELTGTDYAA